MDISAPRQRRFDVSILSLLAANGITIFAALRDSWDLRTLLWVFWWQNCIIGFFHALRMARAQNFYISDPQVRVSTPRASKAFLVTFFIIHFSIFQLVYLAFLWDGTLHTSAPLVWRSVWIAVLGFFLNHLVSFLTNTASIHTRIDLMRFMMLPYPRILPMHFFAILGGLFFVSPGTRAPLLFFLLLKTAADVLAHVLQTTQRTQSVAT